MIGPVLSDMAPEPEASVRVRRLRASYANRFPPLKPNTFRACVPMTPLGQGQLFFLVEDEAEVGVTMANRAMSSEEWAQYCASPAGTRRRKPNDTVDEYEARRERRRVGALVREIDAESGIMGPRE